MIWTPRPIPVPVQPTWRQLQQQRQGFFNPGCSCCGCVLCGIECTKDQIGDHSPHYLLSMTGWGDGTCECCDALNGDFELVWSSGCKWVGCAETDLSCYANCHGNDGTQACGTHCAGMEVSNCESWCPCCSLGGNGGCFNLYMTAIDLDGPICPDVLYSGADGVIVVITEGLSYELAGAFDCAGSNVFDLATGPGTKCVPPATVTVSPL